METYRAVYKCLAICLLLFSVHTSADEQLEREYQTGYALGVLEAQAEIRKDDMTYYSGGLPITPTPGEEPRKKHGLRIKNLGVMDSKLRGVIDGHNKTIEEHLGVAP